MRLCALLWIMVAYPVQFGERVQGHVYIDRPGAYGIALSMQRNILVVAVENLLALPFNKLCEFYEVELIGEPVDAMDSGHQVRLISVDQAIASLTEEAHRWAVARARDR